MKKNILKQLFIVLFYTFAVNNFMFAQIPNGCWPKENSLNIKNVFELYDERGFSKNMETSLDGNLMVNPVNGNLGYTYKINEFTVSDRKITVDLNYCNAVSFTSYTAYKYGSWFDWFLTDPEMVDCTSHVRTPYFFWAEPSPTRYLEGYGGACMHPDVQAPTTQRNYWEQFKQNRPAWIMSVNNFAVQVFGGANFYTCNPFIQNFDVCDLEEPLTEKDVVWTIDGYEVCNSMRNIFMTRSDGTGGVRDDQDCIRILRGDGSILELMNSYPKNLSNSMENGDTCIARVSGIYYENGVNTKGYAVLEFDNSRRQNCRTNDINTNDPFSEVPDRILKYYPGDGLEYVFYEDIAPWGIPELVNHPYYPQFDDFIRGQYFWSLGNWLPIKDNIFMNSIRRYNYTDYTKAYAYTSPTIFYLKEIRTQGSKSLCKIKYKDENEYLNACVKDKYTGGRTNFEGIYLNDNNDLGIQMENYQPKWSSYDSKNVVTITGLGKKTFINLNKKNCNISGRNINKATSIDYVKDMRLKLIINNEIHGTRHSIFNSEVLFSSWLDYIVGIEETDPTTNSNEVNRKTYKKIDFNYQEYERSYQFDRNVERFPVPSLTNNTSLNLKNYRLTEIKKDDGTVLNISYKKRANDDADINILPGLFKAGNGVPNNLGDYVKINNVVDKIETKKGTNTLKTEQYVTYRFHQVQIPDETLLHGPEGSEVQIIDLVNSSTPMKIIKHFYNKHIFNPPVLVNYDYNPRSVHTHLFQVVEEDAHFETTTTTNGEFVAPVAGIQPNIFTITDEEVKVKDKNTLVEKRKSYVEYSYNYTRNVDPADETSDFIRQFAEEDLTENPIVVSIDGTAFGHEIYKKEASVYKGESSAPILQYVKSSEFLNLPKKELNSNCIFPPYFGLVKNELLAESPSDLANDILLNGIANDYQEDYSGSSSTAYYSRGRILEESIFGKGILSPTNTIIKNTYTYNDPINPSAYTFDAGRLYSITNAIGAKNYNLYDYNAASSFGITTATGKILSNSRTERIQTLSNSLDFYKSLGSSPRVTTAEVRKWDYSSNALGSLYINNIFGYEYNSNANYNEIANTIIDPNGWLTALAFDRLKRLTQVNLPYDFDDISSSSYTTQDLVLSSKSVLTTNYKSRNLLHCTKYEDDANYYGFSEDLDLGPFSTTREYNPFLEFGWENTQILKAKNPTESICTFLHRLNDPGSSYYSEIPDPYLDPNYQGTIPEVEDELVFETFQKEITAEFDITADDISGLDIDVNSLSSAKLLFSLNGMHAGTFAINIDIKIAAIGSSSEVNENKKVLFFISEYDNDPNTPTPPAGVVTISENYPTYELDISDYKDQIQDLINNGSNSILSITFTANDKYLLHTKYNSDLFSSQKITVHSPVLILQGNITKNKYFHSGDYTARYDIERDATTKNFKYIHKNYKLDDNWHTANTTSPGSLVRREIEKRGSIGAYYNITEENRFGTYAKSDIVSYNGFGLPTVTTDNLSNSTTTLYHGASDRVQTITYADGSHIDYNYELIDPATITDQEFYGFAYCKSLTDQKGVVTKQFTDAFDRLRREEVHYLNNLGNPEVAITKYEYDLLGHLTHVYNPEYQALYPEKQHIRYWYDDFGRIKYKYHPDMGVQSYAYDDVGNLRFYQTQEQSDNNGETNKKKMTFYQYDDLNRIKIMGEAQILLDDDLNDVLETPVGINLPNDLDIDNLNLSRLTDQIDPNYLHMGSDNLNKIGRAHV